MIKSLAELRAEYHAKLRLQSIAGSTLDYTRLSAHTSALNALEQLDGNCYQIFDLFRREHVYSTDKFNLYFGLAEGEHLDDRTHPDDLYRMTELGIAYLKFIYACPVADRKRYKLTNDFRVATDDGYARITKNYRALELDSRGNIWLALCSLAVSVETNAALPLKSRIVNVETGVAHHFAPESTVATSEQPLSEREKEVLDLIARGYSSKQIAPLLDMSVHTVNTHRQNMIRKMGMKNSAEVVKYASDRGMLLQQA